MTIPNSKPCPFCGSDKLLKISEYVSPAWKSYVTCQECETRGPVIYHNLNNRDYALNETVTLWNARGNHVS